ncbi:MAG: hypothetical protein AAF960_12695 [Bacteroidota bacterium]
MQLFSNQRQYMLGVDFATILKNTGFRVEIAWKGLSGPIENEGLEASYLEYTLGFDRTFSRLLFNKNVTIFGQWVHQIIFKDERIGDNNIRFFLRRALILRTELALSYFSSFNIQALHTLDHKNWYLQPSLRYRFLDGFTFMAQTDILFGKADGFLGQFVGNDRVQVRLIHDF